ncbi:hypothetical protein [Desulfosporosinus meridiei]|uniref:hypothetical protein n=1 Tax=Desulfosporosinus meridiei TaxID=79209 RepID=UPI001FA70E7E|nr:hypothetical protein [Desulfosporosinus meridiei]
MTYQTNYTDYQKEKESRLLSEFTNYQEQQKKIKKMQKALDRLTKLNRPILERKKNDLHLEQSDRSGKQGISLDGISKSYADRSLFCKVSAQLFYGDRPSLSKKRLRQKSSQRFNCPFRPLRIL